MPRKQYVFFIGLIISITLHFPGLIDPTLISRFISITFFLVFILFIYQFNGFRMLDNDVVSAIMIIFFIITILSSYNAVCVSETIFESQKYFNYIVFYTITFSLLLYDSEFIRNLLKTFFIITLLYILISVSELIFKTGIGNFEVRFISGNKNLLSCFLFLMLPFLFHLIIISNRNWKIVTGIVISINILVIIYLHSRATWLSLIFFLIVGLIGFLYMQKVTFRKILFGSIFLVFLGVLLLFIGNRLKKTNQWNATYMELISSESLQERFQVWEKTLCVYKSFFVLGVGAGNWQLFFPKCSFSGIYTMGFDTYVPGRKDNISVTIQRPHNDFLWVLSETGIAGIIIYILLYFYIFKKALSVITNRSCNSNQRWCMVFYIAGLTGFIINSFFDFPKERIEHNIALYSIFAIILSQSKSKEVSKPIKFILSIRKKNWKPSLLISILLFNLCIGFYRAKGEYYTNWIYYYKTKKDWNKVVMNCEKSASIFYRIDPTSIPIKWYKGMSHFILGNNEKALIEFSEAYEISPYNIYVLNNLATVQAQSGNTKKAIELYTEALRISPLFNDSRKNLAILFYNRGEYIKAIKVADKNTFDKLKDTNNTKEIKLLLEQLLK